MPESGSSANYPGIEIKRLSLKDSLLSCHLSNWKAVSESRLSSTQIDVMTVLPNEKASCLQYVSLIEEHWLPDHMPNLWTVLLHIVQLIHIHFAGALMQDCDGDISIDPIP
jgi:hypothetical protein